MRNTRGGRVIPELHSSEVDYIKEHLSRDYTVLEWGSGGSTKIFAPLVKRYISIEHDRKWHKRTRMFADVRLVIPNEIWTGDGTYSQFKDYVEYPSTLDIIFDVVFIDGRARESCLKAIRPFITHSTNVFLHDYKRYKTDNYNLVKTVTNLAHLKKI